ncbi:MAG: DUF87 domain-containing protein [Ruminococcus sp.]|nr:DUF87 domain-containing protein [Ruminococcus sp.]
MKYYYEIFLNEKYVTKDSWISFITSIAKFLGEFKSFKIIVTVSQNNIRYFIISKFKLPLTFNNQDFLIKICDKLDRLEFKYRGFYISKTNYNLIDIINKCKQKNKEVYMLEMDFKYLFKDYLIKKIYLYYNDGNFKRKRLLNGFYANILSIDFFSSKNYFYNKIPKYLDIKKILHLLTDNEQDNLFKVDTFPYLEDNYYLKHTAYDFYKHSLVIGSSGSGKSKFLALFINNIYKYSKDKYKIVVIDPHDALRNDMGGITDRRIIDFKDKDKSIDLFKSNNEDINAIVELMLSLFKSLINDQYNGRLERVLRYSIYLLISKNEFSFINLKKLLIDLDYRNGLVEELKLRIPASVAYFFLTDFNELKSQSYSEAIAPIISFIDEMQMVPIFNSNEIKEDIKTVINDNFLTIFSLNRLRLGDKVTKTIAGFLMQQLFVLAESLVLDKHLIVIIDEVAILENPILPRFLAELRKFNTSVILAGQYFKQISTELKEAIFANTSNYYLFRVSKNDAISLEDNLEIKLANSDKKEDRYSYLTNLKTQECLVRISKNETIYPVFKARTRDFCGIPERREEKKYFKEDILTEELKFDFKIDSNVLVDDVMKKTSTSRKRL